MLSNLSLKLENSLVGSQFAVCFVLFLLMNMQWSLLSCIVINLRREHRRVMSFRIIFFCM